MGKRKMTGMIGMNKHISFIFGCSLIFSIGSTAFAATPTPIPTPTPEGLLFSESFSPSFIGQTDRSGYWSSWATGTSYYIWEVTTGGPPITGNKVFEGAGDTGWEGTWTTETIDISSCGDVEISIDVFGQIVSSPPDSYVEFFYQTDGGSPRQWFYHTGSIGASFVTQTIGAVRGESLWVTFKAVTQFATGDTYVFDNIQVSGVLLTPTTTPTPSPIPTATITPSPIPTTSPIPTVSPTPSLTPSPSSSPTPTPSPAVPPWIYDYNGDGTSDIAIFRRSSGLWAVRDVTR
ncbi:MAG TPA: hypothetical protein ENH12_03460, partial [Proteobacteria bacterium]|nr:hypothetical protein [Pseudomonadota bacterium]